MHTTYIKNNTYRFIGLSTELFKSPPSKEINIIHNEYIGGFKDFILFQT